MKPDQRFAARQLWLTYVGTDIHASARGRLGKALQASKAEHAPSCLTIPLRRFATVDEVSNAAAYLLSDYASYVIREAFVIDGGQWLSGADYWGRIQQMAPKA